LLLFYYYLFIECCLIVLPVLHFGICIVIVVCVSMANYFFKKQPGALSVESIVELYLYMYIH